MDHVTYIAAAYAIALGTTGTMLIAALHRLRVARRFPTQSPAAARPAGEGEPSS